MSPETTADAPAIDTFAARSSAYASRIVSAVQDAKSNDPFAPVTVLCNASAVDDITVALASAPSPFVNVEVQTLDAFVHTAARGLGTKPIQRGDVAAEVARLLRDDAPSPTVFHDRQLNTSPATLEGLTDAVFTLLTYPSEWRELHNDRALPKAVAAMAETVAREIAGEFYIYPEAVAAAAAQAQGAKVLVVGNIAFDAVAEWALAQIGGTTVPVSYGDTATATAAIERASFVAEDDEARFVAYAVGEAVEKRGAALHQLAIAYCDETQLPYIAQALERAGISYTAASTNVWAQNPFFRAMALALRIDPAEMNRRDLSALLATGVVRGEATPWMGKFDTDTRRSGAQFYSGQDWDAEEVDERSVGTVEWVRAFRQDLQSMWAVTTWPELAAAVSAFAARWLRDARGEETIYRDEVIRTLARQQGQVTRVRAVDAVAPLFERSQPASPRGLVTVGPLESLAGRNLHTAFIVGALDDTLPGSITPSPTITPEQSHTSPEEFLDRRRRAFSDALASASRVLISHPRSHQDGSGSTQPSQWVTGQALRESGYAFDDESETPIAAVPAEADVTALSFNNGVTEFPQASTMLIQGLMAPMSASDVALLNTAAGNPSEQVARYRDIAGYREAGAHGDQPGAEYNGFTHSDAGLKFLSRDISNSALERFARSPQFFFVERVLESPILEDNVQTMDVDARERGTLYHEIFERWTKEVLLDANNPPQYASSDWWDGEAKQRFEGIIESTIEQYRSARVNQAVWFGFVENLKRDLADWFEAEREDLQAGWRPVAAEAAFGVNRHQSAEHPSPFIDVPRGADSHARMSFNGVIDRVDYRVEQDEETGIKQTKLRITDYKTGRKHKDVRAAIKASPTGSPEKGHYFQLALYGSLLHRRFVENPGGEVDTWFPEIAEALDGVLPVDRVESRYWYFQAPPDEGNIVGITVDENVAAALEDNLTHIYHYIAAGIFPPHELPVTTWVDDAELRIGRTQYATVADALAELDVTPLPISQKDA